MSEIDTALQSAPEQQRRESWRRIGMIAKRSACKHAHACQRVSPEDTESQQVFCDRHAPTPIEAASKLVEAHFKCGRVPPHTWWSPTFIWPKPHHILPSPHTASTAPKGGGNAYELRADDSCWVRLAALRTTAVTAAVVTFALFRAARPAAGRASPVATATTSAAVATPAIAPLAGAVLGRCRGRAAVDCPTLAPKASALTSSGAVGLGNLEPTSASR